MAFADRSFDRAMALLVLHFVPEAGRAIAEMKRVVRPGGIVAATVWDHYGGMPGMRMMVDTLAMLSEPGRQLRTRYMFQPMMAPGEMQQAFVAQGLRDVEETQLLVRMDYADFDDFWATSSMGSSVRPTLAAMSPADLEQLKARVRARTRSRAGCRTDRSDKRNRGIASCCIIGKSACCP